MEWSNILVGAMALLGTILGSVLGIREANRLVVYRLEQLESKVDRHNKVIVRTYELEREQAVLSEKMHSAECRIGELEQERRNGHE